MKYISYSDIFKYKNLRYNKSVFHMIFIVNWPNVFLFTDKMYSYLQIILSPVTRDQISVTKNWALPARNVWSTSQPRMLLAVIHTTLRVANESSSNVPTAHFPATHTCPLWDTCLETTRIATSVYCVTMMLRATKFLNCFLSLNRNMIFF